MPGSVAIVGSGPSGCFLAQALLKASPGLERLIAQGVAVAVGHDAGNLPEGTDVVAVSTAVPDRNPEVRAAQERAVPVARRAEVLAAICATRRALAVAGTHGKTTTSSMLALILVEAGLADLLLCDGELLQALRERVWLGGALGCRGCDVLGAGEGSACDRVREGLGLRFGGRRGCECCLGLGGVGGLGEEVHLGWSVLIDLMC